MIKYSVRSRQLVDIVGDIKRSKIVLSPYFQRNLVWRAIHKIDFIKTILFGYPFPQIFLAKGGIDAENLTSTSVIVDGQQRMSSILEYLDGKLPIDDEYFTDLSKDQKDEFLKFEIAIIELDMESDNPEIVEVFKRLNRTFYSLSTIERLATEYAPSEFMLVAKMLANEIDLRLPVDITLDPNIPESFIVWGKSMKTEKFNDLVTDPSVFSPYEVSRKVHLMMTLNILATLVRGFFNRNINTSLLEEYKEDFPEKVTLVIGLEKSAAFFLNLKLPKGSYWYNKANFFSLIVFFHNHLEILLKMSKQDIRKRLLLFEKKVPNDYQLAAKEAVNNKTERILRNRYLERILLK